MTEALVAAVKEHQARSSATNDLAFAGPDLSCPQLGNPISHGQIIEIASHLKKSTRTLQAAGHPPVYLSDLLRGSQVYSAPPKSKVEPTPEYKELMARLRREEEARSYERMIASTNSSHKPFKQTPSSQAGPAFYSPNVAVDEDEITFADVNRQVTLIINVLVSIIACGIGIWLVAWHWKAPARLALSMGGSGVVGIAEVVIYAGYLRRLQSAKEKEKTKKEKKTITDTWIIGKKSQSHLVLPDLVSGPTGIDITEGTKYRKGRRR